MTWIARTSARSVRPGAHGVLAFVTLVAMGAAAVIPAGESTARAHVLGTDGTAAASADRLDDGDVPARGGARPAPLGRDRADRRAEAPAPAPETIEVPGLVAEHSAQSALRVPDGAAAGTATKPEKKAPEGEKSKKGAEEDANEKEAESSKSEPQAAPPPFPEGPSRLFANRDGVKLYTPSADPVYLGFHEAAFPIALSMLPLGRPVGNDNGGKYRAPGPTATGQSFAILSSRGRPQHAATAADIVMRPGEPVRSVVTGTVIEVTPYFLYGKYADARVRIRSAEDPSVVVTMLHVTRVWAHVGQHVEAGKTLIAETATSFPFMSQIDYYLGDKPNPHVHVELKHE